MFVWFICRRLDYSMHISGSRGYLWNFALAYKCVGMRFDSNASPLPNLRIAGDTGSGWITSYCPSTATVTLTLVLNISPKRNRSVSKVRTWLEALRLSIN